MANLWEILNCIDALRFFVLIQGPRYDNNTNSAGFISGQG